MKSDYPLHGHTMGNAMIQRALWSEKQVSTGAWRLSEKGVVLDDEAREWRATGWGEEKSSPPADHAGGLGRHSNDPAPNAGRFAGPRGLAPASDRLTAYR